MPRIPTPYKGMTPRAIRRELKQHGHPRLDCQCQECAYGRALLAASPEEGGIARLWGRFRSPSDGL